MYGKHVRAWCHDNRRVYAGMSLLNWAIYVQTFRSINDIDSLPDLYFSQHASMNACRLVIEVNLWVRDKKPVEAYKLFLSILQNWQQLRDVHICVTVLWLSCLCLTSYCYRLALNSKTSRKLKFSGGKFLPGSEGSSYLEVKLLQS